MKPVYESLLVKLPQGLRAQFRAACRREGETMSAVVLDRIRTYVAKEHNWQKYMGKRKGDMTWRGNR